MIPLFTELRPHLEAVFDEAEPGTVHVISRYRGKEVNLRTHLLRIIRRAGLVPWPRVFHNMRASRQNELAADLPIHVACTWIGNTALIAGKHYLEVTDDYFDAALQSGAESGAVSSGQGHQERSGAAADVQETAITLEKQRNEALAGYPGQESNL